MKMTETDTRLGAIPGRSMARGGPRKTRATKEMCQEQTRNVDAVAWTQCYGATAPKQKNTPVKNEVRKRVHR